MLRISFWQKFLDGVPEYLARHYWWAYLWRPAIWFFDHQPIINLILFGQYKRLMTQTLQCLENRPAGRMLQLTCVYGKLTPAVLEVPGNQPMYLIDVVTAQIQASCSKLAPARRAQLLPVRMNAESLAFQDNSFSTVLIFFLMHEMPTAARQRTLAETVRVLQPGGRLVITEYDEEPCNHWIYRRHWLRKQLLFWEPFLEDFWREDLSALLQQEAHRQGKALQQVERHPVFDGFYRVLVYEMDA
ncbi:MAG TPA: class I SAM-dependent methyltransferase [Gammaproteobacteria bacterium]|nr:class I SAM-dependent methyltransferase [Gammaproteobacteria bacterium]